MRKGSALLIVLGMVSFMLFSGIAFSVYMRETRLPSSFLRRTTTTRQLAKAALAEAIEDIDAAIGNDPHPGVCATDRDNDDENGDSSDQTGNYWNHRVLMLYKTDAESENGYSGSDTISTLTLEGLAYLPPALINEARYYSRHTRTAKWQRFRFDAGRFAYCAIDVSDYFDVNRILADRPRSSASSRRITLAHAFEDAGAGGLHGSQQAGMAADWDQWLEEGKVRRVDDDTDKITFNGMMPLVSCADFNLLMAKDSFGRMKSPFVEYLDATDSVFYPEASSDADDAQAEAYRSMTFVTDSLFRQSTTDEKDLESDENQPFEASDLKRSARMTLPQLQQNFDSRAISSSYLQLLSQIGMATLYDYLDENSLPISLTLPTVERNPMICAINPDFDSLSLAVKKTVGELKNGTGGGSPSTEAGEREVSCTVNYILDGGQLGIGLAGGGVTGLALYPFLHGEDASDASFTLDGKLALFLTLGSEQVKLTTDAGNQHFTFGDSGAADPAQSVALDADSGLLSFPLQGSISVPTSVKAEDDALITFNARASSARGMNRLLSDTRPWISITYKWKQTYTPGDDDNASPENDAYWLPKFEDSSVQTWENVVGGGADAGGDSRKISCAWAPLDSDGEPVTDMQKIYNTLSDGTKYHVNFALWLRVKRSGSDSSGTVDLVPACLYDDKEQGLTSLNPNAVRATELRRYYMEVESRGRYVMRFGLKDASGDGFSLKDLNEQLNLTLEVSPKKIMTADPRYNHNPHNWFRLDDGAELKTAWQDSANNPYASRDGDCFMSVSDQGYLQSIYELGFLPRLTDPNPNGGGGNEISGSNFGTLGGYSDNTEFPSSFGGTQQNGLAWRTYRVFGSDADPLYEPGFVSGVKGLKVNPYSDSIEVISAAFANTPVDWRHASTNAEMNVASSTGADDFNKKYAWNAYSTGSSKLMWSDVQKLADAYYDKVRTSPYNQGDWEGAFEDLGWSTDPRKLLNGDEDAELDTSSDKLYSVDKKFLFGFWRDCFAANQQLFLVFVRAEPMMMGGGVAGNAPPQLSSRAVALVWRDPEGRKSGSSDPGATGSSYLPHGLRILFYHPLD